MARFLCVVLAPFCFCVLFAHLTSGAVFERDWKTPGDGLLTYDDVNRREWLDIPVSLMLEFPGDSLEERFQNSLAELEPGGLFDGFTLATRADVISLAQSAGIDTNSYDYDVNHLAASRLVALLGPTTSSQIASIGFLQDTIDPPPPSCPCPTVANIAASQTVGVAGVDFYSTLRIADEDNGISTIGLIIHREVPEPSTFLLVLIASSMSLSSLCRRTARRAN